MIKKLFSTVAVGLLISAHANAADCVLKIAREACPGKEVEAFKPYNGKTETKETKKAANKNACELEAKKAAKIVRKGTLKKKTVSATYDGSDLGNTFSDTVDCK